MHSSHSSVKPQIDLMRPKRDDGCKVRKNDHREKEMLKKRLLVEEKNYPEYGNAFKEKKKIVDADIFGAATSHPTSFDRLAVNELITRSGDRL